ncbi:MAG: glycosyltransferase [Gammaproteobacteria bacterium]|nr:glycosyltransferase [Gammaproteobacteria bacterium]MCP5136111.1 glycosyltransferase [Gammaproteobacteria bacterium]
MRVLHVVHGLPRGGLENGVINLLNGLPEDIEQAVACLDQRGEMADRITRNIPIHVLDRQRHDWRLPFRLARLIRSYRPDVVHCRNWNTWLDAVAAHRLAGRQGRLVWSFHGFAGGADWPKRRATISHWLARFTDALFAVCADSAQRYADFAGIDVDRFEVLYNGVNVDRFQPGADKAALRAALNLPVQRPVVLTVASLTPVKDHAALLHAMRHVLAHSRANPLFLWLGEGALRNDLAALAAELGVDEYLEMPGNSDRVSDYLAAADILVLPSKLEGMSNAILEAMASALPVIANRVGGNPELVIDGETGFLTRQGDSADMARVLSMLIDDPALCRRMGAAGRTRAVAEFSMPAMMKRYADYYRGLSSS